MSNFKKIISELKRRNVFKVATAYAITAWLIIQIVSVIKEPLLLPDWFDKTVIVLFLIGFPIALIFAWAFELTPEGLKKTEEVNIEVSETKNTGKKLNRITIAVLSILVVFLVFDRVFYDHHTDSDHTSTKEGLPSIAVLPFADMSPNKDQEYFSDGLSEELLNVLAKVKDMKVAGRTSSFKFKGKNENLQMIGKELGVDHILEGSVRKSGDKNRVTAQLIKVDDGFHMWSDTYDRNYTAKDLFKIQDEISKRVLNELKVTLLNDTTAVANLTMTKSTKAYESYLRGNQLLVNRNPKEIEQAIKAYKRAINLDKDFAEAYAGLSLGYYHIINYGSYNKKEGTKSMRDNASRALLMDNTLGTAYAGLGHYYSQIGNMNMSKLAMKRAYEYQPNNAEIVLWYAQSHTLEDRSIRMKLIKEAHEIDPLAPIVIQNLVIEHKWYGEYDQALALARENVRINPDYMRGRTMLIDFLEDEPNGKLDEAFIETYKLHQDFPNNLEVLSSLARKAENLRMYKMSDTLFARIKKDYPMSFQSEFQFFLKAQRGNVNRKQLKQSFADWYKSSFQSSLMSTEDKLSFDSFLMYLEEDYQGAYEAYSKIYPQMATDTVTVITKEQQRYYPETILILQKLGKKERANRLIELLDKSYALEYKHKGDYKQEPNSNLWKVRNIAVLQGDYKKLAEMASYEYFVRKNKQNAFNNRLNDYINGLDLNNPYVRKVNQKIDDDIAKMRTNVVFYLKQSKQQIRQ